MEFVSNERTYAVLRLETLCKHYHATKVHQPRVHARGAVRVRLVSAPRLIVRVSQQKLGAAGRWLGHHVAVVEPGALELA